MSDIFVRNLSEEKVSKIKRPKLFASDLLCMTCVPGCAEKDALEALCTISVTWYGINYTGTQITQWNFQNKENPDWASKTSFVLEVSLRYLRPTIIYSVPCDRKSPRLC